MYPNLIEAIDHFNGNVARFSLPLIIKNLTAFLTPPFNIGGRYMFFLVFYYFVHPTIDQAFLSCPLFCFFPRFQTASRCARSFLSDLSYSCMHVRCCVMHNL